MLLSCKRNSRGTNRPIRTLVYEKCILISLISFLLQGFDEEILLDEAENVGYWKHFDVRAMKISPSERVCCEIDAKPYR